MSTSLKIKAEWVGKGFFYLDHTPTGKVYTGTASNMFEAISELKGQLDFGTCKNKALVKLCEKEPTFTAHVLACSSIGDARKAEKEFRSKKPAHLLLN